MILTNEEEKDKRNRIKVIDAEVDKLIDQVLKLKEEKFNLEFDLYL